MCNGNSQLNFFSTFINEIYYTSKLIDILEERIIHRETCASLTNCVCGIMKGKNLQWKFDASDHCSKSAPPSLSRMVTVAGQTIPHMVNFF